MSNRKYILDRLYALTQDKVMAEDILELLQDEGVLHLGYGDADVDRIVQTFQEVFGTTKTSKYDRYAANRLAKKYGSQAIVGIIRLLAANSKDKYAPVVGSITQLEDKLVSVLNFLRKFQANQDIDV